MKLCVIDGRASLVSRSGIIDVETESGGHFPANADGLYERWQEFAEWAHPLGTGDVAMLDTVRQRLGAPSPRPRQIFAIGLNYVDHATESGFTAPAEPVVFTKFASALTGPNGRLDLPGDEVDWEVELVVVIGSTAHNVELEKAWDHVAGLTAGQDYSERNLQLRVPPAQFSLGKSYPGFAPLGPVLVTPEEFGDPNDLLLECSIDGQVMQSARSSDMIFPIADLVHYLSSVCTLLPGDLIFTGTPPGIGMGRTPKRYLRIGEVVVTSIEGVGSLEQTCQSPTADEAAVD